MGLNQLIKKLAREFGGDLSEPVEFRGETTIRINDPSKTALICRFAKESLGFDYLADLSGVDHYGEDPRFEVVYELHGYGHHHYLRLKTRIPEENPEVPSVSGVWRTADWHEREAYDMFGIRFAGHPDLRRILMWEGYPYFPLRKDFPLAGKSSELPEVAFSKSAPMDGGPFVTASHGAHSEEREPRSRG